MPRGASSPAAVRESDLLGAGEKVPKHARHSVGRGRQTPRMNGGRRDAPTVMRVESRVGRECAARGGIKEAAVTERVEGE